MTDFENILSLGKLKKFEIILKFCQPWYSEMLPVYKDTVKQPQNTSSNVQETRVDTVQTMAYSRHFKPYPAISSHIQPFQAIFS